MMAVISIRTRRRAVEIALAIATIFCAWLLQISVLSAIPFKSVLCNLPLIMTIVWGAVFGSALPPPTEEEVRHLSFRDVLIQQSLSGSVYGAMVGALFAALYSSVLPLFPIAYPVLGWMAGYFCLNKFTQGFLLSIPVVFLGTIVGETIMATQLACLHRPDVFHHLVEICFPEAAINALLAPLAYLPLAGWFEFSKSHEEIAPNT